MKVLVIHRQYRYPGGEDLFLDDILIPALKKSEINYECLILPPLHWSIFNFFEIFGMIAGLEKLRPSLWKCLRPIDGGNFTHVVFNNCVPTISLSLPQEIKKRGVKTFAWVHNFRLDCANGLHFNGNGSCHKCLEVGSRWSLIQDCHKNWIQSLAYALIYRGQRVAKNFIPFIDQFICNSDFTRTNLNGVFKKLNLGEPSSFVIPMPATKQQPMDVENKTLSEMTSHLPKPFYLFLGRLSYEKGADLFAELARKHPDRGFVMCGSGPMFEDLKSFKLPNFILAGQVGNMEKPWLFKNCEALIVPSRTPETSSLVISESHPYATPVVYPRGGGAEETFKFLKRTGCALDEFKGQTFTKSSPVSGSTLEDFGSSLKGLLLELQ